MAMGTRSGQQEELWIATCTLARPASHPFYERLNHLLAKHYFDRFVEGKCQRFYAAMLGRPGLAPGVYFRLLLVVISKASIVNEGSRGERETHCPSGIS